MTGIRRLTALLCCLCISLTIIPCEADGFSPMDILSSDASAPLKITLSSPEMILFAPYDENRISQLNRLLRHLSMEIFLDSGGSLIRLMADDREALSFRQDQDNDLSGILSLTDSFPDLEEEKPAETEDPTFRFLSGVFEPFNRYLNVLHPVFVRLPEIYKDLTKSMEANLNLSGYGRGVRKNIITIPAETAETSFRETLCSLCENGEVRDFLSSLFFSGQQKISFMTDKEDRVIRITYDGRVGTSADDLRTVSVVWKCLRDGNHRRDSLTMKTPALKGNDRFNISIERDLNPEDAVPAWSWSMDADEKIGQDRTLSQFTMEWTQNENGLSGKMNHNANRNGEKTVCTAGASFQPDENGSFTGGVEIARKKGKIEKERYTMKVSLAQGGELQKNAAADETGPEQDGAGDKVPADEKARRQMLRTLLTLPDEDLVFLFSGLPEEEWKALIPGTAVSVAEEGEEDIPSESEILVAEQDQ